MTSTDSRRRKRGRRPPLETELQLGAWGQRGAVTADLDGRSIPIDRALPDEKVFGRIDRRRTPWRGVALRIIRPSMDRIEPPCQFYRAGCGGCQTQHMAYGAQLSAKRSWIEGELRRHGISSTVTEVHGMDEPWRYRRTATISLGDGAGFRLRAERYVIPIDDCLIAHTAIGRFARSINSLIRERLIRNYCGKLWLDCVVTGRGEDTGLQVLIQGIEGLSLETHPELSEIGALVAQVGEVRSVSYRHRSGECFPVTGDAMGEIEVDGGYLWLPAGSFCQTNSPMLDRLLQTVRSTLRERAIGKALDVYGGIGTFTFCLADFADEVTLIELDGKAITAARRTAEDRETGNIRFVCDRAERALKSFSSPDLILVDPPRSGLGSVVTASIAASAAPLLLYVSCAPVSLARDLAELTAAGYRISQLHAFDFYPQTYHIETLTVLEKP